MQNCFSSLNGGSQSLKYCPSVLGYGPLLCRKKTLCLWTFENSPCLFHVDPRAWNHQFPRATYRVSRAVTVQSHQIFEWGHCFRRLSCIDSILHCNTDLKKKNPSLSTSVWVLLARGKAQILPMSERQELRLVYLEGLFQLRFARAWVQQIRMTEGCTLPAWRSEPGEGAPLLRGLIENNDTLRFLFLNLSYALAIFSAYLFNGC